MRALVAGLVFASCTTGVNRPSPSIIDEPVIDSGIELLDAGVASDAGVVDAGVLQAGFGATIDDARGTIVFRVFSAHATRLEVSLFFHPLGSRAFTSQVMEPEADGVWRAEVALPPDAGAIFYGYRAWGPNWPYVDGFLPGSADGFVSEVDSDGNRFNPNKLLIDPFAKELSHDPKTPGSIDFSPYQGGATNRVKDSAPVAPKGVVLRQPNADVGARPTRSLKDDVIYEVHLRGLTMNDTSLPEALRGTYAGAARKAAELAALGITAIEFLPVQETQNETNDLDPLSNDGDNYWGYSTLNYFAPDRRYSSDQTPGGPTREFQQMVRAFHDAGLKVFIDVVYNHTGESGTMSFRGLDNQSYYSLTNDRQGGVNNTGVSGNFNSRSSAGQTLIIESLKYWHEVLGVDGFRFDLATVLGNGCEHGCFRYDRDDPKTGLNRLTAALPVRPFMGGAGVDLIAEPWAIGNGTYQVGNLPRAWAEWNDRYRDALRTHQNRLGFDEVTLEEVVRRLSGSPDLYQDDGRPPAASINFLVAHDGFTLNDLYSCDAKNNGQAWPWGPSNGGSDSNRSWAQGGMASAQRQAARTGMAMLMISAGTPMMTGGDEHLRTLRCNNNAYNLDSEKNWLSWTHTMEQQTFATFTQRLLQFRRAHPALRPASFWRGIDTNGNGLEQTRWFTTSGDVADAAYLRNPANHALGLRIDGTELGEQDVVFAAINGWSGELTFTLPWTGAGRRWLLVGDTCSEDGLVEPGMERAVMGNQLRVCGRGVALLVAR